MAKLENKQLKKAARELNELFGLNPKIILTGDDEALIKGIRENLRWEADEDEFTDETQEVIDVVKKKFKLPKLPSENPTKEELLLYGIDEDVEEELEDIDDIDIDDIGDLEELDEYEDEDGNELEDPEPEPVPVKETPKAKEAPKKVVIPEPEEDEEVKPVKRGVKKEAPAKVVEQNVSPKVAAKVEPTPEPKKIITKAPVEPTKKETKKVEPVPEKPTVKTMPKKAPEVPKKVDHSDLLAKIDEAKKLADLKNIAGENAELFKHIVKKLDMFVKSSELRNALIDTLVPEMKEIHAMEEIEATKRALKSKPKKAKVINTNSPMYLVRKLTAEDPTRKTRDLINLLKEAGFTDIRYGSVNIRRIEMMHTLAILKEMGKLK